MPEETAPNQPIQDDGVSTIVLEEEEMAQIDLAENVAGTLQLESIGNIQMTNATNRAMASTAAGVLQLAAARNFDELGVTESRATSGVIATPIAGPTTQAP